jgi:hypothetical protein
MFQRPFTRRLRPSRKAPIPPVSPSSTLFAFIAMAFIRYFAECCIHYVLLFFADWCILYVTEKSNLCTTKRREICRVVHSWVALGSILCFLIITPYLRSTSRYGAPSSPAITPKAQVLICVQTLQSYPRSFITSSIRECRCKCDQQRPIPRA